MGILEKNFKKKVVPYLTTGGPRPQLVRDMTFMRIASIAEVASICAEIAGTNVVFDLPDKIEKKGLLYLRLNS